MKNRLMRSVAVLLAGMVITAGCCLQFVNDSELDVEITTNPAALFADATRTVPANSTSRVLCWVLVPDVQVDAESIASDSIQVGLVPGLQTVVWNGFELQLQ